LQRSGIGDGARLRERGVEPICHLPGVGQNLQDHLQLRSIYQVEGIRSLNGLANSRVGQMLMGLEYAWRRGGPLSMAPSQLGVFASRMSRRQHPIWSITCNRCRSKVR